MLKKLITTLLTAALIGSTALAASAAQIDTAATGAPVDAAIVAGMIHTGEWTISQIKAAMSAAGIPTRVLHDEEAG